MPASILALLTAVSIWLSLGTLAVTGGDASRMAALPSIWILVVLIVLAIGTVRLTKLRLDALWPLAMSVAVWLPFIPGPSAFLIFNGPAEYVVWSVVIVGLIVARPSLVPSRIADPRVAPWLAAALVAAASLAVFSQVRDVVPGGDEPHYLAATQSLLHDGDLKVANNYAQGEYLEYFGGRLEPHFLKRSTSGEIYSIHAPGVSVIVLPAFAVAGYAGAVLVMILIASLTAALTWRIAFRVSGSATGAWIGVLSVFATTPYFLHTFTIYPEIIGSLLVMIGMWLVVELGEGRDPSARELIGAGLAMAILPWLHTRFAVIAALLGIIILLRLLQRSRFIRRAAAFLIVPVIAGVAWFAFFYMIWGSPSPTAPYGADTSTSASYISRGLIGLLFDQQFSVLTTAPIYLMAIVGMLTLFLRQSRIAVEIALIVVPYAITVASYAMWWAGNAAPARFLVAVLPLAALPIAMVGTRAVSLVLLVISIALTVPRGFVEGGRFIFNNRGGADATIEWLTRSVDLSLALPSVHRDGGTAALRDGLIWMAVFAVMLLAASVIARLRTPGSRYASTGAASLLTVIIAATIVWPRHTDVVITPDRSKLAALAAYRPAWHTAPAGFLDQLAIDVPRTTRINRLPAGEYRLIAGDPARLLVGRNDQPLSISGDRLRLPVMLQSPTLMMNGQTLVPTRAVTPALRRNATHAAQYGSARVFAFDEHMYLEPGGMWTRGESTATIVVDAPEQSAHGLSFTLAAPVPTTVSVSSAGASHTLTFEAGQEHRLTLPPSADGVWTITFTSGAGFRPSEREPGSNDVRLLSARVSMLSSVTSE